jgi:hypothetical protein
VLSNNESSAHGRVTPGTGLGEVPRTGCRKKSSPRKLGTHCQLKRKKNAKGYGEGVVWGGGRKLEQVQ